MPEPQHTRYYLPGDGQALWLPQVFIRLLQPLIGSTSQQTGTFTPLQMLRANPAQVPGNRPRIGVMLQYGLAFQM